MHDDVIKWKHFPRYWPFVRGIHRSPVNSPHTKGQWRGALVFSSICTRINGWVNNGKAGDLRRHCAHYDVSVMCFCKITEWHFQGFNSKTKPHHLPHDRTKQCKPVLLHMINYIPMFYIDAIIYQFSKLDAMLANLCWIKWTQGDHALKKKRHLSNPCSNLTLWKWQLPHQTTNFE